MSGHLVHAVASQCRQTGVILRLRSGIIKTKIYLHCIIFQSEGPTRFVISHARYYRLIREHVLFDRFLVRFQFQVLSVSAGSLLYVHKSLLVGLQVTRRENHAHWSHSMLISAKLFLIVVACY